MRGEIIVATKKLLAEAGRAEDVSVRAVAEAVGVTPPSIYLHFADKDALLAAVVTDVFRELDDAMVGAAAGLDRPLERLRAYGLAYVRFALQHPEHYRLATMDPDPKPHHEVDAVLREAAFTHFNATVVDCIEQGIFLSDDPLAITLELWAAAHGVAALLIAKPYLPWGDAEQFADRVLCSAAVGLVVSGDEPRPMPPERLEAMLAQWRPPA